MPTSDPASYDASNTATTTSYKGTSPLEYSSLDAGDVAGSASSLRELQRVTKAETYSRLKGQQAGVDAFKAKKAASDEETEVGDVTRTRALAGNSSMLTELDRNMLSAVKMLYIDNPNNRLLKKLMVAGEDILKQKNKANPELYYKKQFQTEDLSGLYSQVLPRVTKSKEMQVDLTEFLRSRS